MRVLYIHQYFATMDSATGMRSYAFARRLVQLGHQVDMITSDAMIPSRLKKTRRVYQFSLEGIRVHVLRVAYDNRMEPACRMRAFASFALRSCWIAAGLPKPDVIFATSTPLTVGIPGMYAARLHHRPFVFEVRDLWPEGPIALGWLKNRALRLLARWLERKIYGSSQRVVALSPQMAEGVARAGFPKSRIAVIPNCSDIAFYSTVRGDDEYRRRMSWPNKKVIVVHPGAMGQVNGLGGVLDAAPHLAKLAPKVLVALVGDGRERESIEARIARERLNNVVVHDPVPKKEMPRLLAASDVGLMTVLPMPILFANSANKFFDFLAAGLPVVMNYRGWKAQLLRDSDAGLASEPGNAESLAAAIARLASDSSLRQRMGRNARRLAEERFSRDILVSQLSRILEDVVKEHGSPCRCPGMGVTQRRLKRAMDVVCACLALIVLSPLLSTLVLLVRFNIGRPVFYVTTRSGLHGSTFKLYKFRSMTDGRDDRGKLLPDEKRLTPLGRLLRATSLDELLQLINVLKGEMSLVGPRPLPPEYLQRLNAWQALRYTLRPGMSGWAQVNYRSRDRSWEEKFDQDVWYVKNASLRLDMRIILMTFPALVRRFLTNREGLSTSKEFMGSSSKKTFEPSAHLAESK